MSTLDALHQTLERGTQHSHLSNQNSELAPQHSERASQTPLDARANERRVVRGRHHPSHVNYFLYWGCADLQQGDTVRRYPPGKGSGDLHGPNPSVGRAGGEGGSRPLSLSAAQGPGPSGSRWSARQRAEQDPRRRPERRGLALLHRVGRIQGPRGSAAGFGQTSFPPSPPPR